MKNNNMIRRNYKLKCFSFIYSKPPFNELKRIDMLDINYLSAYNATRKLLNNKLGYCMHPQAKPRVAKYKSIDGVYRLY